MQTPCQSHIDRKEYEYVYEPAEDSYLLIDALEKDLKYLRSKNPTYCLEVGSGSGVVVTAFGIVFPNTFCFSTDINFRACKATRSTSIRNGVLLDAVAMDLATCFTDKKFDLVIFNPPYVETDTEECGGYGIEASWAGGVKGREVTDRLLHMIPKILTTNGTFYLLLVEENIPEEVNHIMKEYGYTSETVMTRRVRNEHQIVLKYF